MEETVLSGSLQRETEDAFELKGYAAQHWMTHLEMVPKTHWSSKVALAALHALTPRSKSLRNMLEVKKEEIYLNQHFFKIPFSMLQQPLYFTALLGHLQLTQMLLNAARNEYLTQQDLDVALHYAKYGGGNEVVKYLLTNGANINSETKVFGTALHAAALVGHIEIIDDILNPGANIDAYGNKGMSALQTAVNRYREGAVKRLVARGANINLPAVKVRCSILTETIDIPLLSYLLYHGANINMQDGIYGTALHAAAINHNYAGEVLEILLEKGANVNAKGGSYEYVLQVACLKPQNFTLVERVLDAGADINAVRGCYGTALQSACTLLTCS